MSYGAKTYLLSAKERETLVQLGVQLENVGLRFSRPLSPIQMLSVAQIVYDLWYRTNDEESHVNFVIGDFLVQAEEWFGTKMGEAMYLSRKPTQFQSCFISYSQKDADFAEKLHARLLEYRIPVWYAPEDMRAGDKLYTQITQAITQNDRLLVILSEHSLRSNWVATEIRKAITAEGKEKRHKLFPIRLAAMDMLSSWECFDADTGKDMAIEIRQYYIPDFSKWQDPKQFDLSCAKLLDDLKTS
ncbi:MAG: toll/interleukin-1 receptor domain-containing protein [Anaerolineae bacterium]|nr:toll/interleukin-1 receptor domain-containing protein [Anaerolineae bacterium]